SSAAPRDDCANWHRSGKSTIDRGRPRLPPAWKAGALQLSYGLSCLQQKPRSKVCEGLADAEHLDDEGQPFNRTEKILPRRDSHEGDQNSRPGRTGAIVFRGCTTAGGPQWGCTGTSTRHWHHAYGTDLG